MKTVYFDELGYLTKSQCEKIKSIIDGKTYMHFRVSYSGVCNCVLACSTDYDVSEQEIKNFFIYSLLQNI